jgi:hypothetical protein
LLVRPCHFKAQGIHVDLNGFVQYRKDQRPGIHNHLLAAETRSDERGFLGCFLVPPRINQPNNEHGDRNTD